jgi:hypothetical protein
MRSISNVLLKSSTQGTQLSPQKSPSQYDNTLYLPVTGLHLALTPAHVSQRNAPGDKLGFSAELLKFFVLTNYWFSTHD